MIKRRNLLRFDRSREATPGVAKRREREGGRRNRRSKGTVQYMRRAEVMSDTAPLTLGYLHKRGFVTFFFIIFINIKK